METFAYRIKPTRADMLATGLDEREQAIVGEHFAYLQDALARGVLLLAGRTLTTDERSFGIAVFRAETLEAAQAFTAEDPAVRKGVMRAEVFPFHVALLNTDWS
jgi:uncharacterized protein YciI